MAKEYVLHGTSYVAKVEAGNKLLELHPLNTSSIVVNKRIKNGWRTVGADILLSTSENGAINETNKRPVKFKAHELVIATNNSKDGLTGSGVIKHGKEIFKEALAQMEYTKNFYERAGLPIGLIKVEKRLNAEQSKTLREEWKNLYGGVQNSSETAVLQEGMSYQPLSPPTLENDTSKISIEICKVFNVPYGLVAGADSNKHSSLEQSNSVFLANCLKPIIVALETAIDKSLLLESEKKRREIF
ncbi:phage portal protein [Bacillus cereus]